MTSPSVVLGIKPKASHLLCHLHPQQGSVLAAKEPSIHTGDTIIYPCGVGTWVRYPVFMVGYLCFCAGVHSLRRIPN